MILKQISSRQKEIGLLSIFAVTYITQLILSAKLYILIGMCILVYFIRIRERKYSCITALLFLYLGKYAFSIKNLGWNPVCLFGYMLKEASEANRTETLTLVGAEAKESMNDIRITQEDTRTDVEQIAQPHYSLPNTLAQTLPQESSLHKTRPVKILDAATNIMTAPSNPAVTKQAYHNNSSEYDTIDAQPVSLAASLSVPITAPLQGPENDTIRFETLKPQQNSPAIFFPVNRPTTTTNTLGSQDNSLQSRSVYAQQLPSAVNQPAFQPVNTVSYDTSNNQMLSQRHNFTNPYYNQPIREYPQLTNHYQKELTQKIPVYKSEVKTNITHTNLQKSKNSELHEPMKSISKKSKVYTLNKPINDRIKFADIRNYKNEGLQTLFFYTDPSFYQTRLQPKLEELKSESFEKQMQKFLTFFVLDAEQNSANKKSKWKIDSAEDNQLTVLQRMGILLKNTEIMYVSINKNSIVGARRKSGLEKVITKSVDDNGKRIIIPMKDQKEMVEVLKYIQHDPKYEANPLIAVVFETKINKK